MTRSAGDEAVTPAVPGTSVVPGGSRSGQVQVHLVLAPVVLVTVTV